MVSRRFPSLNTTSCCQSRAVKYKTPNKISGNRYSAKYNELCQSNYCSTKQKIFERRCFADVFHDRLNILGETYKYIQWHLMIIDATGSKLFKEPPVRCKRKHPKIICKVCFCSNVVEPFTLNKTQFKMPFL